MKVQLSCISCGFANEFAHFPKIYVELVEEGALPFTCETGHSGTVVLLNARFAILFDVGALALIDGYHREAIASFASALERFYEFYVRAVVKIHGLQGDFEKAWKEVSHQSERQLGMFVFAHLLETGRMPDLLPGKLVQRRNNVVHRGEFVSREEATEFGDFVLRAIQGTILDLESRHAWIVKEVRDDEAERRRAGKAGLRYFYSTLINCEPHQAPHTNEDGTREEPDPVYESLESALTSLRGHQKIFYPRPGDHDEGAKE